MMAFRSVILEDGWGGRAILEADGEASSSVYVGASVHVGVSGAGEGVSREVRGDVRTSLGLGSVLESKWLIATGVSRAESRRTWNRDVEGGETREMATHRYPNSHTCCYPDE